jgi:tetratricopeptide (TPR) repeat protein
MKKPVFLGKKSAQSSILLLTLAALLSVFSAALLASALQESTQQITPPATERVDPFYKNLLEDGKFFFQSGKYPEAIENLEIAYFGYLDYPHKLLECYIYLEVCHFQIKNAEKSLYYYNEIKRLKLEESLEKLTLPKSLLDRYREISAYYDRTEPKFVNPPVIKETTRPTSGQEAKDGASVLNSPDLLTKARTEIVLYKKITLYKQALEKDPLNTDIYFEMKDAYVAAKKYREAAKLLELLLKNHPEIVRIHRELGGVYLSNKDYDKAAKALAESVQFEPENIELRYSLGKTYMGAKKFKEAAAEFNVVLARDPKYKDTSTLWQACLGKIKK